MLRDDEWRGVDVDAATRAVMSAIAAMAASDSAPGVARRFDLHVLAALSLMGTLPQLPQRDVLVGWIVQRQVGGFQGRPGKDEDTCYSFWFGASLVLLGAPGLTDLPSLSKFAMTCECPGPGGVAKSPATTQMSSTRIMRFAASRSPGCASCSHSTAGSACRRAPPSPPVSPRPTSAPSRSPTTTCAPSRRQRQWPHRESVTASGRLKARFSVLVCAVYKSCGLCQLRPGNICRAELN